MLFYPFLLVFIKTVKLISDLAEIVLNFHCIWFYNKINIIRYKNNYYDSKLLLNYSLPFEFPTLHTSWRVICLSCPVSSRSGATDILPDPSPHIAWGKTTAQRHIFETGTRLGLFIKMMFSASKTLTAG